MHFQVTENQYSCPLISPDLPARVPCQPPFLVITYSEACQCWIKLIRSFCLSLKLEYPETNVHSFLTSIKLSNSIVTQCSRKCSFLESWNMHRLSVCLDYHQLVIARRLANEGLTFDVWAGKRTNKFTVLPKIDGTSEQKDCMQRFSHEV